MSWLYNAVSSFFVDLKDSLLRPFRIVNLQYTVLDLACLSCICGIGSILIIPTYFNCFVGLMCGITFIRLSYFLEEVENERK